MGRLYFLLGLLCINAIAQPAVKTFIEHGPQPWTNLNVRDDGDKFQFAIVTDRTGGMRPGVFESAVEKLNLLQPCFVMSVGDLIEGGGEADRATLVQQWDEFDSIVDKLEMPFFYVPGNHDVTNSKEGRALWQERVGPLFYHFLYKNVLFICMNSDDDGVQKLGDEQIAYVKKTLTGNPDVRWTFVFYHKPIFTIENSRWAEVEALLQQRPHTVFSGHRHDYMKYTRNSRDYFVLGTTGGGMGHEGAQLGDIDQVVWVTMDSGGPEIANLLLDGILDKDYRTDIAAGYSLPLLRGQAAPETQVWVDGNEVRTLKAHLALNNPIEVPVQIIGRVQPSDLLQPDPQRFDLTLAPGTKQEVEVSLNALEDLRPDLLQSMVVEYAYVVQPPDQKSMMFSGNSRIYFDSKFGLDEVHGDIVLDGVPKELEQLRFRCNEPLPGPRNTQEWDGPADASFDFGLGVTDDTLYVCVRVVDDRRQVARGWRAFKQDGLELRFDARPEADAGPVKPEEDKDQSKYLYVALNPFPEEPRVFEQEKLPEGVHFVCRPSDGGYIAEGTVPLALLERMGGKSESFRLNISVYDYDQLSDSGCNLSWRPDWNAGKSALANTGRFYLK